MFMTRVALLAAIVSVGGMAGAVDASVSAAHPVVEEWVCTASLKYGRGLAYVYSEKEMEHYESIGWVCFQIKPAV
jgi:hypothetical protein